MKINRSGPLVLVVTLLGGIILSALSSYGVNLLEQDQRRLKLQKEADRLAVALQRSLYVYVDIALAIGDYANAVPGGFGRKEFATFVGRTISLNQGVQAAEWVPRVTAGDRAAFEAAVQAEGYPNFQITERNEGTTVRASERKVYYPATFIEPMRGNENAFGFDLGSNPDRLKAIQAAVDSGVIAASGRIRLIQETNKNQFGFLIFVPVYTERQVPPTTRDRRDKLAGLAVTVFRAANIVEDSLQEFNIDLDFYLYDEMAPEKLRFFGLYNSATRTLTADETALPTTATEASWLCPSQADCTRTLKVGNRLWSMVIVPTPSYVKQTQTAGAIYALVLALGLLITGGLTAYLYFSLRHTRQIEQLVNQVEIERGKADDLLLNILPKDIAEELKRTGTAAPVHFDSATVLFADVVNFTQIAESLRPQELVGELTEIFSQFDQITEKHHLEKIKTIGDTYMIAGGVPVPTRRHTVDCVLAALEMQAYMNMRKIRAPETGLPPWELRIGISTGPLVAGVLGKTKFAYDVFGDTVVTASRMESSGSPGRINMSGVTYGLVKNYFECEYRGKVSAKGKGEIDMYFAHHLKPELSQDSEGLVPNEKLLKELE